jgi:hypothetical protein
VSSPPVVTADVTGISTHALLATAPSVVMVPPQLVGRLLYVMPVSDHELFATTATLPPDGLSLSTLLETWRRSTALCTVPDNADRSKRTKIWRIGDSSTTMRGSVP